MYLRTQLLVTAISLIFLVCRAMNVPWGHPKGNRPLHQEYYTAEKIANFVQPYYLRPGDFEQKSGMIFAIISDLSRQIKALKQSEKDIRSQLQKEAEETKRNRIAVTGIQSKVKSSDKEFRKGSKFTDQVGIYGDQRTSQNSVALPKSLTPFFMGHCILCPSDPRGPPGPPGAAGPQGLPGTLGIVGRDERDLTLGPKGDDGSTEGITKFEQ